MDYRSYEHKKYQHYHDRQWFGRAEGRRQPRVFYEEAVECGCGVFHGGSYPSIPEACHNFVLDQMFRFGLRVGESAPAVIEVAAMRAFCFLSYVDPYVLFTRGLSDVKLSDDWTTNTYEIRRPLDGGKTLIYEPNPEEVESFELAIAEGEAAYRQFMTTPWLGFREALENKRHPHHDIVDALMDEVDTELRESGFDAILTADQQAELRLFCTQVHGGVQHVNIKMMEFYFHFAAWAALVWALSPLSTDWRCAESDLISAVHESGEAIIIGHTVFQRGYYRKTARPIKSCHYCHIQSWCLADKLHGDTLVKICEFCATDGLPILPPANCGFRLCKMPACKHHPFFTFDPNRRLHHTMQSMGQLGHRNHANPLLSGSNPSQGRLR